MNPLQEFQDRLGIHFNDVTLLERAFIHRSYLNEHPKLGLEHNERITNNLIHVLARRPAAQTRAGSVDDGNLGGESHVFGPDQVPPNYTPAKGYPHSVKFK